MKNLKSSYLFINAALGACLALSIGLGSTSVSAQSVSPPSSNSEPVTVEFQKIDNSVGAGAEAKSGMTVTVHYTGWLYEPNAMNHKGRKFDSSLDRGQPFNFPLGAGRVIRGWDEGVAGMKVGGKRTLVIPPQMGYGPNGAGNVIPPNAILLFDVELLGVK